MSEDLTPRQQILLWDLISRGGSALQKDLRPEVKPADREPLVRAKMLSVAKDSRAFRLTLEDAGWNGLASTPPTLLKTGEGSKYDRPILQFVLRKIQEHALSEQTSFSSIFSQTSTVTEDIERSVGGQKKIWGDITKAFYRLAGRPARNYVRLRALRAELGHIPREVLDQELIKLWHEKAIDLSTLSNPPDITKEEDAPLQAGSATFHTIWVHP